MTDRSELLDRLYTLAAEQDLQLPSDDGTTDGVLDSIAILELFVAIENEFGVSLLDDETDAAQRLKSIDTLVDLIMERLA